MRRKLKTIENLEEFLDNDLGWRKKEIIWVKMRARSSDAEGNNILLRSGYALLSAHFQGFFETAIDCYCNYVSCQNVMFKDVKAELQALEIGKSFRSVVEQNSKKISSYTNIINEYNLRNNDKFDTAKLGKVFEHIITVNSNPKPDYLREALISVGLSKDIFKLKENFISENLLKLRHRIVHGGRTENLSLKEYTDVTDTVLLLLDKTEQEIIEAATNKRYLK